MSQSIYSIKRDIIHVGKRVYERGYVASNDGNISARIDDKKVLITPTGVSKGFMEPDDLVLVDYDGNILSQGKKPSSEVYMHLRIYKERPDINSVCHAHPIHATGYAVAGKSLDKCVLPEVVISLGAIPLVEYGTPGTAEFYTPLLKYLQDHEAFLLANHGALTIGTDVLNAYHKMETLEHFAHINYIASQVGHINVLPKEDVRKLYDLREKFGINSQVQCESCDSPTGRTCEVFQGTNTMSATANTCSAAPKQNSPNGNSDNIDKEALVKMVTEAVLKKLK